jgi:hypothetical protein
LHFSDSLFEGADDAIEVGVRVFSRQKAREVLQDVDTFLAQAEKNEAAEAEIRREAEIEDAGEVLDVSRNVILLQKRVQARGERSGLRRQFFLKRGSGLFQVQQDSFARGHRQRMPYESARHERHADFGIRIVTVPPRATVERIHVLGFARKHADGHSAGKNFSVGGEIRTNIE